MFHQGKFIPKGVPDTFGFNGIDASACTGDTVALKFSNGVPGLESIVRTGGTAATSNWSPTPRRRDGTVGVLPYSGSVFVDDGIVFYSASDLAAAARCEYALLRSFDAHLGWGPPVAVEDELLARTAQTRRRARTPPSRRASVTR